MKKMIFELFVCLLLIGTYVVITIDTVSADQDSDYNYTVNLKGEANITGYTGKGGAIIIPSTLSGYPTVVISSNAFAYCSSITSVTIPISVTTIGNNAFYYCTSISSVNLPKSVITIGSSAFAYCSSLTSMTLPNSLTTIGDSAFYSCTKLTLVNIPDNVIIIGISAFHSCTNLTSVNIPNSVTIIGEKAFWGCSALSSITIGNSVITIGSYAFYQCASLNSINFLGRIAPTSVSTNWIIDTPEEIKGHAYANSNFPTPGGNFYGLTMGTMLISENEPPVAGFSYMPLNPTPYEVIMFNASLSSDPDGFLTLFEWDWNNDSVYEESYTIPTATNTWTKAGNYPVLLCVTDNEGEKSTKTTTVLVINVDQTPGFELVLLLCAIVVSFLLWKNERNT